MMDPTPLPNPVEKPKKNKMPQRLILIAFLLIAALLGRNFILRQYDAIRLSLFSRKIASTDQIIGTWTRTSVEIKFTGEHMKKIVRATSSATSARMPDADFMCMFDGKATFYKGTKFLGETYLCNGLFHLGTGGRRGPPFYDNSDILDKTVYTPLLEAIRNWQHEQSELQQKQKLSTSGPQSTQPK